MQVLLPVFFSILFLFTFNFNLADDCIVSPCSYNGPEIRFPFRLKSQPLHCGYTGFVLTCNNANETVLEMPSSPHLLVSNIYYSSQKLSATLPTDGCFPRGLVSLNLSNSPFSVSEKNENVNGGWYITIFKCSSAITSPYSYMVPVSCLNGSGPYIYATSSYMYDLPPPNCSIIKSLLYQGDYLESRSYLPYILYKPSGPFVFPYFRYALKWETPRCGDCKRCRYANNSTSEIECVPGEDGSNHGAVVTHVIIGISIGLFVLLLAQVIAIKIYLQERGRKKEMENQLKIEKFLENYKSLKPTRYSYAEIKRMTNHFKIKLGQGGYGSVFQGKIPNGVPVAVKILENSKGNGEEFINEVGTLGKIHHINVVRLVGFCAEGFKKALVYEFMPNGSLEKLIFSTGAKEPLLALEKIYDITIGIARGIEYLHQGCDQRILHFDIKPHNILLDENFNPKISDFGLAKLCSKGQSIVSMTTARGTMGYIAPEMFSRNLGNVSYKSDIYSFGMLLLEMVGGRKNIDATVENASQVYFPEWIYNHLVQGEELRIKIAVDGDKEIAKKLTIVALWCIQWYPVDRPSMNSVVQMLEGRIENLSMPPNPFSSGNPSSKLSDEPRHTSLKVSASMSETHLSEIQIDHNL